MQRLANEGDQGRLASEAPAPSEAEDQAKEVEQQQEFSEGLDGQDDWNSCASRGEQGGEERSASRVAVSKQVEPPPRALNRRLKLGA